MFFSSSTTLWHMSTLPLMYGYFMFYLFNEKVMGIWIVFTFGAVRNASAKNIHVQVSK